MIDYAKIKADAAQYAPGSTDAQIAADAINSAPAVVTRTPFYISARTILGVVQDPARLETMLQSFVGQYPATYKILTDAGPTDGSAGGLDNQAPGTIGFINSMIDHAAVGGVAPGNGRLSPAEAATLLALGTTTTPYVVATYGVPYLSAAEVAHAWSLT